MSNISKRIEALSPEKRALLEARLREKDINIPVEIKSMTEEKTSLIKIAEEKGYYPLSAAQKRMYILNQLEDGGTGYNTPIAMIMEGTLDKERLQGVLKTLIKRHEAFRTTFEIVGGEPVQKVHEETTLEITHIKSEEESVEAIIKGFIKPFSLKKAPLLRVGLIELSPRKHIMVYDMHHIISDGTSMGILTRDFARLYNGEPLRALRIQYKDFAEWHNDILRSEEIKKQEAYWLNTFQGEIPNLNLPTDYPRPGVQSFEGSIVRVVADAQLAEGLKRVARETGTTLYMVLMAAYSILLHKHTGQEDIIIGCPVAGRRHKDIEDVIGMFVSTLPMRNRPQHNKTIGTFLKEVKQAALEAYENQDYPFEELVEKLNIGRDFSRNPLFDTLLTLQNMEMGAEEIAGLKFTQYKFDSGIAKFDLMLLAVETAEGLSLTLEYCTKLFHRETIERLSGHYISILKALTADIEKKIADIEIMSEEENRNVLYTFNDTQAEYPEDKTIIELFEAQVERTPEHIAVAYDDPSLGNQTLTYKALNERANQLARVLTSKGVQPDSAVGIMMGRSLDMVIGILGILKAGGAYLPIDPDYPVERINDMLKDADISLLLADSAMKRDIEFNGEILFGDDPVQFTGEASNLKNWSRPEHLAYIIYTSGSTGRPKGAMIEHRGLVNYIWWAKQMYIKEDETVFPLHSSLSFDLTVTSVFTPLICGGSIIVYNDDGMEPTLLKIMRENKVSIIKLTPSHLALIKDRDNRHSSVKRLIVGGEDLQVGLALAVHKSFGGDIEIFNEYGPTETVVGCMIHQFDPLKDTRVSVPIGKPAHNVQIYVLDVSLKPVAQGGIGEICISGDGVCRGYKNRLQLTRERFVDNPFVEGRKMYRTGDLARRLPDGNLEFLGRIDHQVKIRGYRIELGEIEGRLLAHDDIKEAIVIDREGAEGERCLCAYIVSRRELTLPELRAHLSARLPDYMLPSHFVQLPQIPLTPNGKIDRKALPAPDGSVSTGIEYVAPKTDLERMLADILQTVLKKDSIGINDNFFDIGGSSLAIIQVNNLINERLMLENRKEIALTTLFQYPTISSLVQYLRQGENSAAITEAEAELSLMKSKTVLNRAINRKREVIEE